MSNEQISINNQTSPSFTEIPDGEASVETYTVVNSRNGPDYGIIIGRLNNGVRFIANSEKDKQILDYMSNHEMLGKKGFVVREGKRNIFKTHI